MIEKTAGILKALGEPTRLKIIKFLSVQELCICELTAILDISQPRVSQHVKVLKHVGLVKERKVKQKSYFSINGDTLRGSNIESFNTFMQYAIEEIDDLDCECYRFAALDSNEDVLACRTGCIPSIPEMKIS